MSTQTKTKAAPKAAEQVASKAADEAVKTTAESYEKVVETTREQVEKAGETVAKSYGDITTFQKDGMDALVKAGEIWAKGAEQLSRAYLALAQEAAEANSEAAKAIFSAKSLKEVVDLQNELFRKNFDRSLAETTKFSEMSVKVATDSFQPLQKQFEAAFEKVGKVAA